MTHLTPIEQITPATQVDAELYGRVAERVLGQLLQTLLYEDVLPYRHTRAEDVDLFTLQGQAADAQPVQYRCEGLLSDSFQIIRLHAATLQRVDARGQVSRPTLHLALSELLGDFHETPHMARFVQELEHTLAKDLQARSQGYRPPVPAQQLGADALERHFMDAHSYHPCYKSRIGFSLADNRQYGPEFAAPLALVWLGVERELASSGLSRQLDEATFWQQVVGEQRWTEFSAVLAEQDRALADYQLIPVHTWQWEQVIQPSFQQELAEGRVLYLGASAPAYRAQQSIRTLANVDHPTAPYVKLALSITNTSSTRILARHTVLNGPLIADWLQGLIATDATARDLGFVILGEIAGASFDYARLPATRQAQVYGTLGAIWRENLNVYLQPGEEGVPFNGLSALENRYGGGVVSPFIAPWIERHGLHAWTAQLLRVSIAPIVHMLYAEGIGMESHGQNIVLIHRDGWPERIALKDFHDGVRYSPAHLARPERAPQLMPLPESHARINRNSFILTDDLGAVRDFSCDAFFFVCLGEMAIFLRQQYGLDEGAFWAMAAQVVLDYQAAHPQHAARFAAFDVFAPSYEVEALTQRRLLGDGERRFKTVPNPLHPHRPTPC
ncbi:IucA/IucC family siderophore biosynthesis protein [Pseudomonas sp. S75]|uniref:IucA/IucC family protein n=1 Tax=unclassified Pseudomonas TaxID=196821 RepID=UPI0019054129|nr:MULTISPECIES: IucA/IucC family protein [unclassified Pseudomonas]MBJ9978162.1 IucA/IucC family siderophore biosynthesis protein [Pseudomonas sp. S30]MBK0155993.1 IucA/IucC family siderophore biosynthesis protein [Pseudomonas sp. S75]